MTAGSILWGAPEWLWPALCAGAVGGAAVWWSYARAAAPTRVRTAAAFLKGLGLAALLFCLLEPLVAATRPRPGANILAVLVDKSRSMQIADGPGQKSRLACAQELLSREAPWLVRLRQTFDVRTYAFADRVEALDGGAALEASGTGSALAHALASTARRFRGLPLAGMVVLTDGNATDDTAVLAGGDALPPVYPVAIGSESAPRDIAIADIAVTQTTFEESPVTIRAVVMAHGFEREPVVLDVRDEKGAVVATQRLEPGNEGARRQARIELKPEHTGLVFYEVRAAAVPPDASATPPPPEAVLANNARRIVVERPAGPFRILYVAGRSNWEFKFLRRALQADKELELVGLIRVAAREPKFTFLGRPGELTNPLYRGFEHAPDAEAAQYFEPVMIRVGTRDDSELRGGFPSQAEELCKYHAVVFDDVEAAFFTHAQMLLLQEFVSRRGGGFLMLGGAESFAQGAYRRTPIADLLPVYLEDVPALPQAGRYRFVLTREGRLQPWVRLRATEPEEEERLAAMPELRTVNRTAAIKPGAELLANVQDARGTAYPALAAQRFGRGRTAALLVGDLWRWGLGRDKGASDDLATAWRQLARFLVAEVPGRVEVHALPRRGEAGTVIDLRVAVRDRGFKPLDDAAVAVTVTAPDGNEHKLDLEPLGGEEGVFAGTFYGRLEGAYRARAAAKAPDGTVAGEDETGWVSEPSAEELRRIVPDRELLARIARTTGGETCSPDALDRLAQKLPEKAAPVTEAWLDPLWQHPFVFLFAMLCLLGEWGLRRMRGLP